MKRSEKQKKSEKQTCESRFQFSLTEYLFDGATRGDLDEDLELLIVEVLRVLGDTQISDGLFLVFHGFFNCTINRIGIVQSRMI